MSDPSQSTSSSSTTSVPAWMSQAGQDNYNTAKDIASKPWQTYSGQRVADFNTDQQNAFNQVRQTSSSPDQGFQQARGMISSAANAGPQSVNYGSILDPNSGGGSLGSYMSQYAQGAINPTLQAISRQGQLQQNMINSQATGSGAFGDARQGVLQGVAARGTQENIGNAEAQGMQNAYTDAENQKRQDMSGQFGAQQANAGYNEQALQRQMSGANALAGLDTSQQALDTSKAKTLLEVGNQQQASDQQNLNNKYQDFVDTRNWPIMGLQLQEQALGMAPHDVTTTGTSTTTSSGGTGGMFGSLLGTGLSFL